MVRSLTADEKEYLFDAMYGYLNGYNDIGENEYPKLTVDKLALYGYETIEFDKEYGNADATAIYFCGKDAVMETCREMIRAEKDFSEVCIDW